MIRAVTDREFDQVIERARMPVLVEFWQSGCDGCRAFMAELEVLQAETAGRLLILMMNVQENFQIPAELKCRRCPLWRSTATGCSTGSSAGRGKKTRF